LDAAIVTEQRELESFMSALETRPPETLTACHEWTVHDIAAHLAGNSAEIARIVEAYHDHRQVPETETWSVREAGFREMDHRTLLRRIVQGTQWPEPCAQPRAERGARRNLPWTQRQMKVGKFGTHMRGEFELHH
jgi:hypothetical protein